MNECGERRGRNQMRGHMARKMAMMMAMGGLAGVGRGMRGGGWGGPWGGPGDDAGWGEGRGGRGGPGGRGGRRMFAGGELRLVLLRLVADQSRHGYELIKAIEELTGGEYAPSPGVVYPTLSLLVDEGKLAEATDEGIKNGGRKSFFVTDEGTAELGERADEAEALVTRLKGLAGADRHGSPPVKRAMANLFVALRQRMAAMGDDAADSKDIAHAVADILDEAARKIERL